MPDLNVHSIRIYNHTLYEQLNDSRLFKRKKFVPDRVNTTQRFGDFPLGYKVCLDCLYIVADISKPVLGVSTSVRFCPKSAVK
ncbi:MAG: hypothetical protein ABFD83_06340 [Armatimonadota bacterium]